MICLMNTKKAELTFEYRDEINKWTKWKEYIYSAEEYFLLLQFGFFPGISLSSIKIPSTKSILLLTLSLRERNCIGNYNKKTGEETPSDDDGHEIELIGMMAYDHFINFGMNEDLKDKEFILFYSNYVFLKTFMTTMTTMTMIITPLYPQILYHLPSILSP